MACLHRHSGPGSLVGNGGRMSGAPSTARCGGGPGGASERHAYGHEHTGARVAAYVDADADVHALADHDTNGHAYVDPNAVLSLRQREFSQDDLLWREQRPAQDRLQDQSRMVPHGHQLRGRYDHLGLGRRRVLCLLPGH
jgi:hypothetical protein